MSSALVILLPARERGTDRAAGAERDASMRSREWAFVLSHDGREADVESTASIDRLPPAERTVLVVHDEDATWLSARLPKASPARMREVLQGLLEEQLIDALDQTHLALADAPAGSEQRWVAALDRAWLASTLALFHESGRHIDALVCASEPASNWAAHARLDAQGRAQASVCGPEGVFTSPLDWAPLRRRLPEDTRWTSEPAAAVALRDLLAVQAPLTSTGQRALRAATTGSNLLQFEFTPQMKGSRALRLLWDSLQDARWRAARVGLAVLVLVQLVGLNAAAWRSRAELRSLDEQARATLQQTFPSVKVVLDPVVQMEREVQALRRASGQPGPTDLETWVDLVSPLWAGQPEPIQAVRWDTQGMSFEAPQWPQETVQVVQAYARRHGWSMQQDGARLRLSAEAAR